MNVGLSQGSLQGLLSGKRDKVAGTCAQLCPTLHHPLDVAHQAPLYFGFPRQKYWNGLHFLLQAVFLIQGSNPCLLHWQMDSLLLSHLGRPLGGIENS